MIAEAGLAELLVRTLISLGVVLSIVAVSYIVLKRRATGRVVGDSSGRGRRRSAPAGVEIVSRLGLSRGNVAVAIRFGEKILLVSASEQAGTQVLGEMSAADWDELRTVREPLQRDSGDDGTGTRERGIIEPRPSFLEALRQATARHG